MPAKKGIARFVERSVAAIVKEYKQLDQGAFPGKPEASSIEQKTLQKRIEERHLKR